MYRTVYVPSTCFLIMCLMYSVLVILCFYIWLFVKSNLGSIEDQCCALNGSPMQAFEQEQIEQEAKICLVRKFKLVCNAAKQNERI